jgi:DNA primase
VFFTFSDVRAMIAEARPSGPGYARMTCPFHRKPDGSQERCPSMRLRLETGRYFCFACKAIGDIADLVPKQRARRFKQV